LFANIYAGLQHFHFVLSYWQANNWYNPTGTFIYQSFSADPSQLSNKERKLLIPRIEYRKIVFDNLLSFAIRYEPVIELQPTITPQHAFSCYLRVNVFK
jgi:hypothetical protein